MVHYAFILKYADNYLYYYYYYYYYYEARVYKITQKKGGLAINTIT